MAKKSDQKKQRNREKKRLRDRERQRRASEKRTQERVEASQRRARGRVHWDASFAWPLGECYISENWHEHGPALCAVVTRRSEEEGPMAAAWIEMELETKGVQSIQTSIYAETREFNYALSQRARDVGMLVCKPETAAAALEAGLSLGEQPSQLQELRAFLHDVDASRSKTTFLLGPAPEEAPPPGKGGIFSRLNTWFRS